jgi:hypothetical protein
MEGVKRMKGMKGAVRRAAGMLVAGLSALACRSEASASPSATPSAYGAATSSAEVPRADAGATNDANAKVLHPWPHAPDAEPLATRFREPPPGFTRVPVTDGSLPAFLRTLPLTPAGTKVVDYRGAPLYEGGAHPNIAAVVDIDVGTKDLQQCADAVYRLHAEWRYTTAARKDVRYRALSGTVLPYARYLAGERAVLVGKDLVFQPGAPHTDDHAFFRSYLDDVFAWASTASLERDGKKVGGLAEVQAGDAFVLPGSPFGHAVVVLDVAQGDAGRVALLLGQSYMPAQSVHVLRPDASSAWFVVTPTDKTVATPFWRPFPIDALRRLP